MGGHHVGTEVERDAFMAGFARELAAKTPPTVVTPILPKPTLDRLQAMSVEGFVGRDRTSQELRVLYWFHEYLAGEMAQIGAVETGYSFSQKGTNCLMVYKAVREGIPQVVFTSEHTPMGCMISFCRRFYGGRLKWANDKYAKLAQVPR
jgi:hypothetical protein